MNNELKKPRSSNVAKAKEMQVKISNQTALTLCCVQRKY